MRSSSVFCLTFLGLILNTTALSLVSHGTPSSCAPKKAWWEKKSKLFSGDDQRPEQLPEKKTAAVFEDIYVNKVWHGDGENVSLSGSGSSIGQTMQACRTLTWMIQRVAEDETRSEVRVLDAPMGDFFWMRHCLEGMPNPKGVKILYSGLDVAPTAVALAEKKRAGVQAVLDNKNKNINIAPFGQADLAQDSLAGACGEKPCDVVLCNDALMHNPHKGIRKILRNFNSMGAKYLIVNSYVKGGNNSDIELGQFRRLDLDSPPYGSKTGMVPICSDVGVREHNNATFMNEEFMNTYKLPVPVQAD